MGKTETLREFCKGKPHVFYSCTESTDKQQLSKFSKKLLNENIPAKQYISEFADWESALRAIKELPYGDKKKLVIIDEFSYMCRGNAGIPSIIQNLWDAELKDSNVMLVLCGSAMSFIEKELLAEKNPLYGRATGIYKMTEMGFYDACRFFPDYSDEDKVLTYAILGGIPHYLCQFDAGLSVTDNIKKNILSKGAVLYSEVDFLLHQELRETSSYNAIIEAVALGNKKLNDISQKSLIEDNPKTSVYLKKLISLDIVEKEFSVDTKAKEKANSNRGIYRLKDNFFRFWYAFGYNNYSQLEDGDIDGVYQYAIAPLMEEFASFVFEDICREFVKKLQKDNALPFRYSQLGRWMGKTTVRDKSSENGMRVAETEIDILGIGKDNKEYLVGECKYKKKPFNYSEFLDIKAKLTPVKNGVQFYYALFSKSGFDKKVTAEAEKDESILLFDMKQIVNYEK